MIIKGHDIYMARGDSEHILVSMEQHDGTAVPFVTGDVVYLTVKINAGFTEKEFQKKVTTFTAGEAIIPIVPADTKDMEFGHYVYDIQMTRKSGEVKTIITYSNFVIGEEVTYE